MDQHFGRQRRLTTPAEFTRCYRHGWRLRTAYFTVYAYQREDATVRLGLAVGKGVGPAVIRNRVKRRLREVFRRQTCVVPYGYDIFVRAMPASASTPYAELERAWLEVVGQLRRRDTGSMTEPSGREHL